MAISPCFLLKGCVDARVPPDVIMGENFGNIFVHRNVANLVVNTDANLLSALQYGVNYLKIKHIIVCGHYECGGMKAAMSAYDHQAPLELWLRNARDVYRLHRTELDAIKDPDKRFRRFVELNVAEQCVNIFKTECVQKRRQDTVNAGETFATPRIHALVFDPKTGELSRVNANFQEYIDELDGIYNLYPEPAGKAV